jgi:carbamoyl-phosphate synthase/aspartate carbamoyltransferase/dihydroorotase
MKTIRLPGLTDVHVHLRVPGGEHKEDIRSGTSAALAGGFTTILAMPNTSPPLTTRETIKTLKTHISQQALCDVFLYAGVSPDHTNELSVVEPETAALKLYLDQTYGPLRVDSLALLLYCFRVWPKGKVIALHAEGTKVAVGIGLAASFNQPVHFCHVSRKDEIMLIAAAKNTGLPVTCEVTPHHLFLTESDAERLGPLGDMRPSLASAEDVNTLWSHIDTTIDCIATDHAPHTLSEKMNASDPQPGVPGLETALPLMLTAVYEGRLKIERLVSLMSENPRRILNLPPQSDTWIDVEFGSPYTISNEGLYTKCGWSPFSGLDVRGRIDKVFYQNRIVVEHGRLTGV